LRGALLTFSILPSAPNARECAEGAPQTPPPEKTAKCLEAAVNPVTGHAVCINPRGAPVEPPPVSALKPCKPRAHDKDDWTVYERWSGC
jgi:hypothetical protein